MELIHHLHGDILRGNFRVVGKKFLAVDENLGHFLALGCDFAVGAHFHARKTLEQVFDHGVGLGLVGVGIIFHRVLFHRDFGLYAHYGSLFKHDSAFR